MNKLQNAKIQNVDRIWIGMFILLTFGLALVLAKDKPEMIVLIPISFFVIALILGNKEIGVMLAFILLPLLTSGLMSYKILPVSGAKINNIVMLIILLGFLMNYKLKFKDVAMGSLFYFGSVLILMFAVLRSSHVADFSMEFWEEEYSPVKFFLSNGLIPFFTLIPTLMIISTVRTQENVRKIMKYFAVSMIIFASSILVLFVFKVPFGSDFETIRSIIGLENLGMHGNNLADFFIIGFPLVFAMAISKNMQSRWLFSLASILSVLAVLITYSRTAYFILLATTMLVCFIAKRYTIIFQVIVVVALVVILVPSVANRALTGIESGDKEELSAGRTDQIWSEVLRDIRVEAEAKSPTIWIGHGRNGVLSLPVFRNQRMLRVTHAHNMYIDTLVDTGLIGLGFYIFFYAYVLISLLKKFFYQRKAGRDDESYFTVGLLAGIVGFLGRGLTDSFLIPQLTNSYVYILMALSFIVLKKDYDKGGLSYEKIAHRH